MCGGAEKGIPLVTIRAARRGKKNYKWNTGGAIGIGEESAMEKKQPARKDKAKAIENLSRRGPKVKKKVLPSRERLPCVHKGKRARGGGGKGSEQDSDPERKTIAERLSREGSWDRESLRNYSKEEKSLRKALCEGSGSRNTLKR